MRIKRAIPLMVASLALIASPVAAKEKTIQVDCSKGQSINQALRDKAEELIIQISGMCQERVVVTRDNVTLIGSDPVTDGVTGPALDDPWVQRALVRVNDGRNVRLEKLTITASVARTLEIAEKIHSQNYSASITCCNSKNFLRNVGSSFLPSLPRGILALWNAKHILLRSVEREKKRNSASSAFRTALSQVQGK